MKLITLLGFIILSLVFVAGNSFAQLFNPFLEGLGPQVVQQIREGKWGAGIPGAGGPIKLYAQSTASSCDPVGASTMITSELRTPQGEYLAEIRDLVIDPANGSVSSVVLTGIRGMGAKDVVIPFSTVSKTGGTIFVYSAPEEAGQFYSDAPYWRWGFYLYSKEEKPMESYTASKLIGTIVRTAKGEDLGRIDDLVIDPTDGHILSSVVSHNGKMVSVPLSFLSRSGENTFVLNTTKEELEAAPAFKWSKMTGRKC